ncbi:hypothetical protein [Maricaulis maris]|uniref:Uncharacterized protein n=1 Tax=Maricaulis maris TaxID=74318 RepID=A0A495DDC4_9PROT|nr:hypothetical protein [Maricaulis maris]RKR00263.1 hypothetical protein C7435_1467 [Maricaulis maris]
MEPNGFDIPASERAVLGEAPLTAEALRTANINPTTGLATDYLNHFNEVVMLMEMLPDMPDCAEDVLDWAPADYPSHFANSSFKDKELAILAYRAAPNAVRAHLETLILQINGEVERAQSVLRETTSPEACARIAELASEEIRPLISAASGTIHGGSTTEDELDDEAAQANVDALFG